MTMRIACLQFAPQVGDVDNNLNRADAVLSRANPQGLDLLVLPELAFTGYNFKSLQHISPFLEPTTAGITSLWARTTALKYNCVVTAGYPEKVDITPKWPASPEYYNSAITVNREGETIANYRKSFLYYTDETWALEGPDGFYHGEIDKLGNVAMGICMDLNPYKFEAPWSSWEFAYHVLHKEANLVIVSMAWLTREDARSYSRAPKEPDMDTLSYWLARLEPLIRNETVGEIIVVFANRCGVEDDAVFAGTSAVLGIEDGEVKVYGILGRGERELLVVDTNGRPQAKLVSLPVKMASEFKKEQQADEEQDTHLSDSKLERLSREEDWNIPEPATNSTDSGESVRSNATNPSLWTNGSSNPGTPDTVDLCEALDVRLQTNIPHSMMDEIVTPISPVDPESPTSFFFPLKGRYPELVNLQDGLKSSIGHQEPGMTSIRPESPKIIRPPSTKSRNTSQTRRPKYQEPALISHDLADEEPLIQITPGVPLSRLGSRSPPEPDSASTMPEQTLAASPGPYQTLTPKGLLVSPRPKSACW